MKKLLAGAFAGALALSGLAIPAQADTPPPVQTGAVFNNPAGSAAEQNRVRDHIVDLINRTESGRLIRASMYALQDQVVADAFVAAKQRGVNVQLVIDSAFKTHAASQTVINALGTNKSASSYVVVCPTQRGCISTVAPSINHNKVFLFSKVGTAEDVLVTASANFTDINRTKFWNNSYTHVGDTTMYLAYRDFWRDQASGTVRTNNYATQPDSPNSADKLKMYSFPRTSGDPVATIINSFGGTGTTIRVANPSITRVAVANALLNRAKAGAKVEVAYTALGVSAEPILRSHPNIHLYPVNETRTVHSKYFSVEGSYAGVATNKAVWVGSHNLNMSSLIDDDENILRVINPAVHDAYKANFKQITCQR